MSSRRLKVDRTPALGLSALTPGQQLEVRKIVGEEIEQIKATNYTLVTQLEAVKVYVCNLSTIMRDIQSSVTLAKYGTGSTKAILAELIQTLEASLENVQHLPPSYGAADNYNWLYPSGVQQNGGIQERPDYLTAGGYAPDPDEYDDPVSDVSDF